MASSTNLVILLGNLTRDPELRYTPNGAPVCSGGIATNQFFKNKDTGENESKPEFHNFVVWGKLAEIFPQFLRKGSKVQLIGRLQTQQWEDDNGVRHYKTEVNVRDAVFLDKKSSGSGDEVVVDDGSEDIVKQADEVFNPKDQPTDEPINEDDIPF